MSKGNIVGSPRGCWTCGQTIRFRMDYTATGARKLVPVTPDGLDHVCPGHKHLAKAQPNKNNAFNVALESMYTKVTGQEPTDTNTMLNALTSLLGMTRAQVLGRAEALDKLAAMEEGNASGKGNGTGDVSEAVDRAVEAALRARLDRSSEANSGGEGTSGDGAQSEEIQTGDEADGEKTSNAGAEGQNSGTTGDEEEGSGTGRTSADDAEGVPSDSSGNAEGGKADGETDEAEDAEGREKGSEARAKDDTVNVDKEVLKHLAQILKDQIKEETTVKKEVILKIPEKDVEVSIASQHKTFGEFVQLLLEDEKPFLVGPAGSGKTTAAEQAAPILGKVFNRPDYTTYVKSFCMMSGKHELEGFIDANGQIVDTDFRTAFIEGHMYFMDEADATNPNVLLVLNAAIENKIMSFPDGMKRAHEHFRVAIGGNTIGLGADAFYSGRTQLDAAFRNRFYFLPWEYDEEMELKWAGEDQWKWVRYVQLIRSGLQRLGRSAPRIVVSPRASIKGAKRLRNGSVEDSQAGFEKLANALIWQGCPEEDKQKVLAAAPKH